MSAGNRDETPPRRDAAAMRTPAFERLAGALHDMRQFAAMLDDLPREAADALCDAGSAATLVARDLMFDEIDGADALVALTNHALAARCAVARMRAALPRDHASRDVVIYHARALLAEINRTETRVRGAFPQGQTSLC